MSELLKATGLALIVQLGFAAAPTAVTSIVATPRGLVPGAAPLTGAGAIAGSVVTVSFNGGTDGERYDVVVTVATAGGPLERAVDIAVLEPAWLMPDGGTPWINLIEFVERLGLDEAIEASDRAATGTIDRGYLIAKLADAQAECETNVAARYALPIVIVPPILKTAVAAIARVMLYPRDVPVGVADAAKSARATLKRIADGALPLPLPAGDEAEEATSEAPITGWSSGRTYPDGLADY